MKRKLFLMLVLFIGMVTGVWAASETIALNLEQTEFNGTNVSITSDWLASPDYGVYISLESGMTISTTNGKNITKVELTIGTNYYDGENVTTSAGTITNTGSYSEPVIITDINSTSVTIGCTSGIFFKEVEVTYEDDTDPQPQTEQSETIDLKLAQTEFNGTNVNITSYFTGDEYGVYVTSSSPMTISTTNGKNITQVVLSVGANNSQIEYVDASGYPISIDSENSTVTVSDINNTSVTISCGGYGIVFSEATVTYEVDGEPQPQTEQSETITTNLLQTTYEGANVTITADNAGDDDGIWISYSNKMTISTTNGKNISSVVLIAGYGFDQAQELVSTDGEISSTDEETKSITISNINNTSVTINCNGNMWIKKVTVTYEVDAEPQPQTEQSETIATDVEQTEFSGNNVLVTTIYSGNADGVWVDNQYAKMYISTTNGRKISSIELTISMNTSLTQYLTASEGTVSVGNYGETATIADINAFDVTIYTTQDGLAIKEVKVNFEAQPQDEQSETIDTNWGSHYYDGENVAIHVDDTSNADALIHSDSEMTISSTDGIISSVVIYASAMNYDAEVLSTSGTPQVTDNRRLIIITGINSTSVTVNSTSNIFIDKVRVNYMPAITLAEDISNSDVMDENNGKTVNVILERTLRTGGWNTFAAPFAISDPTAVFGANCKVKQLCNATLIDEMLVLDFEDATSIEAGKPYLVMVEENVVSPSFIGVTLSKDEVITTAGDVEFVPTLGATLVTGPRGNEGDTKSVLFIGANNKLYHPTIVNTPQANDSFMKGFRAYFRLTGETGNLAKSFKMNTDQGETTTGIISIGNSELSNDKEAGALYTIDGRRVNGKPTQKGVYIVNGKKVVIK